MRLRRKPKTFEGVKLVVFDHDGVIFDGSLTFVAAELAGKKPEALQLVKKLVLEGRKLSIFERSSLLNEIFTEGQKLIVGLTMEEIFKAASGKNLIPGIKDVIKALYKRGYMLGIITVIDERLVSKLLKYHKLDKYFSFVKGTKVKLDKDGRIAEGYENKSVLTAGKGHALEETCREEKISFYNVCAIGDGLTDFHMFRLANYSIIVEHFRWRQLIKRLILRQYVLGGLESKKKAGDIVFVQERKIKKILKLLP